MASKVTEISFVTPFMSAQLPGFDDARSGWNDNHIYHYAIFNKDNGKSFSVRLILSGKNLSEDQRCRCRELHKRINAGKPREDEWQWWTIKIINKKFSADPTLSDDEYRDQIFAGLNKVWEEINKLEQELGKA